MTTVLFRHPGMEFKLSQGVTTVVSGNCGFSAIPADPKKDSVAASGGILAGLEGKFTDLEQLLRRCSGAAACYQQYNASRSQYRPFAGNGGQQERS